MYSVLRQFRSRQIDPQLAKRDCLFRSYPLTGNFYPQLDRGDLIDKHSVADCRALLLDLDHPTNECFRFLEPFEAWVYHTARSTRDHPRLRVLLPLAEPLPARQAAAAYQTMNVLSGGDAGFNQLAFPPIEFLGGPDPTVRFRAGRLLTWIDLEPLTVEQPDVGPVDIDRPRIIKSRSVRRLYQIYREGDNFQRALQTLLGDRLVGERSVRCPLPGHANDDAHPSATVLFGEGQLPVLCCHMGHGHGRLFMNLGELELHKPSNGWHALQGETLPDRALNPATQLLGHARLLFRSGAADVASWTMYPDLAELREAIVGRAVRTKRGWAIGGITLSSTTLAKALDFLVEFTACKRLVGHITYTTLTVEFIRDWMDVDYKTAWIVKQFLAKAGAIVPDASVAHGRAYEFGFGRESDDAYSKRVKRLSPIRLWTLVHPSDIGSFRSPLDDPF